MADISLIRGDTLRLWIDRIVYDGTEREYELKPADKIFFEVKQSVRGPAKIHKEITAADIVDGKIPINILPADTENLEFGAYVFDVRLYCDCENIYTIVPYSKFEILRNVTDIPKAGDG